MTEATQQDPTPADRPGRSFAAVGLVLLCVAGAVGVYLFEQNRPPVHPAVAPAQQASTSPAAPSQADAQAQAQQLQASAIKSSPAPSVDVVRVDKNGALVMAGRAQPGETLTVQNGGTPIGTVTADANGQWVFLPDAPIASGVHQLSVARQGADKSDAGQRTTVLLSLPNAGTAEATASVAGAAPGSPLQSGPMVVLSQGNTPPRLLLAPPGSHPGPVGLDVVQYDEKGRIRFTGHAQPGRTVRLYVNDKALGDAVADAKGVWSLAPSEDLAPGLYKLRTDELAPSGKVVARSETPFARADAGRALAPGQAIVQPGDCLWTIARRGYGHGVEYTAIFAQNLDQIRDPDKIYPGQAFHMPTADEAAHAPSVDAIKKLKRSETSGG